MSTAVGWSWPMGDKLSREIENPLYRYLIAISKLRLGILTEPEQGELELEGSYREPQAELVPIFTRSPLIQVYLFNDLLCHRQCLELATRPPRGLRELLRDRTPATFPLIYSSLYYYLFIYLFRSSGWVS